MGGVGPAALDAVTLDAYGTLLELDDPLGRLQASLAARGVERSPAAVGDAFAAEVGHYAARKCGAATPALLDALRRECAEVFTRELGLELDFAADFAGALVFRPLPGVPGALRRLRSLGLSLAVVSNWDIGLAEVLERAGIRVETVVTCAEAGAAKPGTAPFELALARLAVRPERALHVGDAAADRDGAAAAGLRFAPAPLAEVVAAWA